MQNYKLVAAGYDVQFKSLLHILENFFPKDQLEYMTFRYAVGFEFTKPKIEQWFLNAVKKTALVRRIVYNFSPKHNKVLFMGIEFIDRSNALVYKHKQAATGMIKRQMFNGVDPNYQSFILDEPVAVEMVPYIHVIVGEKHKLVYERDSWLEFKAKNTRKKKDKKKTKKKLTPQQIVMIKGNV